MQKPLVRITLATLFWMILWGLGSMLIKSPLLLPSPLEAFKALTKLITMPSFYSDVGATFWRCFVGILLSSLFGAITAILSYISKTFRVIISLPVNFLKAVPVMAVIIYGLILLTSGNVPTLACFLMCYPIVHINILAGLDYLDSSLLEMSRLYGFSRKMQMKHIYLPSLLPQIKSSFSLMAGLSWKSVIAAEVLSVPATSMGYRLLEAKIYIETDVLFAWVIAIVGLSLAFERSIKAAVDRLDMHAYQGSKLFSGRFESLENTELSSINDLRSPAAIELQDLCKQFGQRTVLNHLSLTFAAGRVTAITAPSGKGKTTILRLIASLEQADTGAVIITPPSAKIAYLFQEDRLLPWLNVFDNMAVSLKMQNSSAAKAHALIYDMAEKLEISDSLHKLPAQLSGGMKHRVAIGRTLLFNGEILLLDEPFRGLDKALRMRLTKKIRPYLLNRTTLLVTHDNDSIENLADTVISI